MQPQARATAVVGMGQLAGEAGASPSRARACSG